VSEDSKGPKAARQHLIVGKRFSYSHHGQYSRCEHWRCKGKIMRNIVFGRIGPGLLLGVVVLVSLGVRVWGTEFGLPEYTRYHPDEHALVERAAAILWTGDWNLHRFNYPPLYAYLQAGAYALYFLYGVTQELWQYVPTFVVPNYYLVGRLVTATFGTLSVLVVYLTGRQLWGRRSGLLAAVLLGTNYLHVIHSHYATFDIMVGFWVLLTLLFSDLIRTQASAKWYFLAGLCAGFAGATKYNGAVAMVMPLLAHIFATPWGEWGWLNGRLFLTCGAFLLGFFGGNPFALGNLPDFLSGLATVLHHYGTEHPGFEGTGNWRWYPGVFLRSADSLAVVAGAIGLFGVLWRDWRKGLLVLAFPVLYYLMVARFVVRFERNMVPLLPFLALGGGCLLDTASKWLARTLRRKPSFSHVLAALGAVVLISLPLAASVSFDHALSQTDQREIAGRWVEENIDPETKIAIEHYSIPFDYDQYHVEDVLRVSDHSLEWYQEQGFAVVIVSDGVWEILRRQPEFYGERLAVYDDLAARATLLAEFVPEPSKIVVAGYPTVRVYHFAPVRIYDVSR
jgi:4-amino-4-deoxy-L-arabinose transferase-like glycosyltransferase